MRATVAPASFEGAARHLFRHLHDPAALRRNWIARRFFENVPGRPARVRDHTGLATLHELVRRAGLSHYEAELEAGRDERAERRLAIVMLEFLERRSHDDVAVKLALSRRQYYRERTELARAIAQEIVAFDDAPAAAGPVLDELEVLFDNADLRANGGDRAGALRTYDEIARSASDPNLKIRALCRAASLHLNERERDASDEAYRGALSLLPGESAGREVSLSRIEVALLDSDFAWYEGRPERALAIAKSSARDLAALQTAAGSGQAKELLASNLTALATQRWLLGDLHEAMAMLTQADAVLRDVRTSPFLAIKVALLQCRLRNRLAIHSEFWQPASKRLAATQAVYERARHAGSLRYTVRAATALCEHYAHAAADDAALATGKHAIALAERMGSQAELWTTLGNVATLLLQTKYWRPGYEMLQRCRREEEPIAPFQNQFDCSQAFYHVRSGRPGEALAMLELDESRMQTPNYVARARAVRANASEALGRHADALSSVEEALAVAEDYGCAMRLKDAYRAAANVTHEEQYRRKAREVQHVISA